MTMIPNKVNENSFIFTPDPADIQPGKAGKQAVDAVVKNIPHNRIHGLFFHAIYT